MQRKPSYYLRTCVAAALGAAAGVAVALQIETTHAITHSSLSATPSLFVSCTADCMDHDRECGAGIDTGCIYL